MHNFKWGQVSALVALGIALSFVLQQQGRSAWGGAVLAAVTSIKYYPGIFMVYFLIRRDMRFLVAFGAGLVGCYCVLPALLLGPVDWWHFERASLGSLPGAALLLDDFNTQYFPHVINRLGFPLGYSLAASTIDFLRWLGLLIFCANCVLVGWFLRWEGLHATALSATALFLSLPFVVQTSWPHYFVYLPFCQMALWLGRGARQISVWSRRLLRIPLLFSIALANIYFFNLLPSWRLYNGLGMLFFADASLLFALYGTVALWRSKRK